MATNHHKEFAQNLYVYRRITQQSVLQMFCQNIGKEKAIKANLYFYHYMYKSMMENITAIKTFFFINAYAMNISAKFQLYPPYSF